MEPFYKNEYRNSVEDLFIENKFESFDNEKALELLLLFSLPIHEAGPVAKRLIKHFGSLDRVISASYEELVEIGGMDRDSAVLVSLTGSLNKRAELEPFSKIKEVDSSQSAIDYFTYFFSNKKNAGAGICYLDEDMRILTGEELELNDSTAAYCLQKAKENNALAVVLGCKTKDSDLRPDESFMQAFSEIRNTLVENNIKLMDVAVIGDENVTAFAKDIRFVLELK